MLGWKFLIKFCFGESVIVTLVFNCFSETVIWSGLEEKSNRYRSTAAAAARSIVGGGGLSQM